MGAGLMSGDGTTCDDRGTLSAQGRVGGAYDRSDEVLCPGCGSTFRLRHARHTNTASLMRRLGKFQLLERVGLGAFGAVWRARDTELDRVVALKIPHAGRLIEPDERERFQRE